MTAQHVNGGCERVTVTFCKYRLRLMSFPEDLLATVVGLPCPCSSNIDWVLSASMLRCETTYIDDILVLVVTLAL